MGFRSRTRIQDVFEIFTDFGKIVNIRLALNERNESKGFCFIDYDNPKSAQNAIKYMSGYKFEGAIIRVEPGNSPKPKNLNSQPYNPNQKSDYRDWNGMYYSMNSPSDFSYNSKQNNNSNMKLNDFPSFDNQQSYPPSILEVNNSYNNSSFTSDSIYPSSFNNSTNQQYPTSYENFDSIPPTSSDSSMIRRNNASNQKNMPLYNNTNTNLNNYTFNSNDNYNYNNSTNNNNYNNSFNDQFNNNNTNYLSNYNYSDPNYTNFNRNSSAFNNNKMNNFNNTNNNFNSKSPRPDKKYDQSRFTAF